MLSRTRNSLRLYLTSLLIGTGVAVAAAHEMNHVRSHPEDRNGPSQSVVAEAPFLSENAAAMDKMMADMNVEPTGDVDADFAAMMIPHHQGAIDMALAELRYGKNEQLRRIAQEIIVEQQQEIAAMRLALGQPLPPSVAAPTQVSPGEGEPSPAASAHDHSAMSQDSMPMTTIVPEN